MPPLSPSRPTGLAGGQQDVWSAHTDLHASHVHTTVGSTALYLYSRQAAACADKRDIDAPWDSRAAPRSVR